jgi:hypothetical protein
MKYLTLSLFLLCGCSGHHHDDYYHDNFYDQPSGSTLISTFEDTIGSSLFDDRTGTEVARVTSQYTQFSHYNSSFDQRIVHKVLVENLSPNTITVTVRIIEGASFRTVIFSNVAPSEFRSVNVSFVFDAFLTISQECTFEVVAPIAIG